jgi:thioredoxin-related protein
MNSKISNRFKILLRVIVLTLIPFNISLAKDFDDAAIMHIDYPSWFKKDPFFDLAESLEQARSSGKQGLMVFFTTEGCSYCAEFIRKSLSNPEIASLVQKNFDTVGLEIFNDTEMTTPRGESMSMKQFAKEEGAEFAPTLLFFGDEGKNVLRAAGYQSPDRFKMIIGYLTGKHYQNESLANYVARQAEKKSSTFPTLGLINDPLFSQPPYALDRSKIPASQPLLVIFEQAGCKECLEFHTDVLALNEVREVLKQFEIVRLDINDARTPILAPGGDRVTPASWFKQTSFSRVPALLFFDEKGNEVLKTDALVLRQRMMNSMNYVLERAYEKDWSYQRFARSRGLERYQKQQGKGQ